MNTALHNPYSRKGEQWVQGNLHFHCSEMSVCASVPLREGLETYAGLGCRFLAVTDHDHVTYIQDFLEQYPDMLLLSGFEYSTEENLLFVGESVPPLHRLSQGEAMRQASDLLTIVCHPDPYPDEPYWTREQILALGRLPDGVEVYNGHYGADSPWLQGTRRSYTAFWDDLLSAGLRLWGFANDDFHDPPDAGNAFNVVRVEEVTAREVLEALRAGCCYGSTGLLLDEVDVEKGTVTVQVADACVGRFVGPGGGLLLEEEGRSFSYGVTEESYVRFEAFGESGQLWLQPFFRLDRDDQD